MCMLNMRTIPAALPVPPVALTKIATANDDYLDYSICYILFCQIEVAFLQNV